MTTWVSLGEKGSKKIISKSGRRLRQTADKNNGILKGYVRTKSQSLLWQYSERHRGDQEKHPEKGNGKGRWKGTTWGHSQDQNRRISTEESESKKRKRNSGDNDRIKKALMGKKGKKGGSQKAGCNRQSVETIVNKRESKRAESIAPNTE